MDLDVTHFREIMIKPYKIPTIVQNHYSLFQLWNHDTISLANSYDAIKHVRVLCSQIREVEWCVYRVVEWCV